MLEPHARGMHRALSRKRWLGTCAARLPEQATSMDGATAPHSKNRRRTHARHRDLSKHSLQDRSDQRFSGGTDYTFDQSGRDSIAKGLIMAPLKHTHVASASVILWWSLATSCQAADVTGMTPTSIAESGWTGTGLPGSGFPWMGGTGSVGQGGSSGMGSGGNTTGARSGFSWGGKSASGFGWGSASAWASLGGSPWGGGTG